MGLTSVTSGQVAKHKDDKTVCGEIVGWSSYNDGEIRKVTIRKCVGEEFVEETFDARDLDLETDAKKSKDMRDIAQWVTIFYVTDSDKVELPEFPMSHCRLLHVNKAKGKDMVEAMVRDLLLTENPLPHQMHLNNVKNIKVWGEDKTYLGSYDIERIVNITKQKD